MPVSIASPSLLHSPLAKLDARWKVAAFCIATIAVGSLQRLGPAAAALAAGVVAILLARAPLGWFVRRVAAVVVALAWFAIFVVVGGLSAHEDDAPLWFGIISPAGMQTAGMIIFKAVAILSMMLAALLSGTAQQHCNALRALGAPSVIVYILALTGRYLGLLQQEFTSMRHALRTRGYRQRLSLANLKTVGHVAGMLLIRSAGRAERVAQAMRARAFDGRWHSLTVQHATIKDALFGLAIVSWAMVLVAWDMSGR
jgi:cobalt/nickel transport system permease protein